MILRINFIFLFLINLTLSAQASAWSSTEVQWLYGDIKFPSNTDEAKTSVFTLTNSSGGDSWGTFLFIDRATYDYDSKPGDNIEFVSKYFANYSLSTLTGKNLSWEVISDTRLVAGYKHAPEVDSLWFMPGIQFELDLPGFDFSNLRFTYYKHQFGGSKHADHFTVRDETSSYVINFAWKYPFMIGSTHWTLEGFAEFVKGNTQISNFGTTDKASWLLAQPQLRMDLGDALGMQSNTFFVGIEYQFWNNKLGNSAVDESSPQFMMAYRF